MNLRCAVTPSRATVRKLGIALLVLTLVAGAGCSSVLDGGGGDSSPIEHVPEGQNVIVEVDASITEDDTVRRLLRAGEDEQTATSDEEIQAYVDIVESSTGLDPTGTGTVTLFGSSESVNTEMDPTDAQGQAGLIVSGSWSVSELREAANGTPIVSLAERDYRESDVFYRVETLGSTADEPLYVGVLGDGTYVLGDERSVRGSLDTEYADASAIDGPIRSAYDSSPDGHVTVAASLPEDTDVGDGEIVRQIAGGMQATSAAFYTEGDTVGMEARLVTSGEQAAQGVSAGIDLIVQQADDPAVAERTESLEVSQDGADVTVTYEEPVETLLETAESQ